MIHESLFILVPTVVLLVALPLTWWAWRGRRVDDHPICRKCGFDLFGKPPESTRCNECGADLSQKRALRLGNRAARRRVLAAAVPALFLSVACLGVLGYARLSGVDWNRHKPVSWLLAEAEGADAAKRDAAFLELTRRIAAGLLTADAETALVDKALANQADLDTAWVSGWGEIVEATLVAKRLSPARLERYLMQALTLTPERVAASVQLFNTSLARRDPGR